MRNLKKVLALALVTVMLLGMMAMASAKGYADEDVVDAKYDVAVDVMQAIGVFEGTKVGEDTYLYPTNTLTRAEAAKVITYIAMTKANASKLGTAEAPFADVAADHWAAGSIAYAKQLGIVAGVGENNYAPNGTLTGYQFAKMLLVVLGYKADNQGYVGSNWSTNVNADALKAGLLKDLSISLADNITREQAAQMAFNALQAKTAYYEGNTSITIGDVVLAVGGSVKLDETTLANKLYPTLVKQDAADDAFGYNVCDWYLGETKVATAKDYTVLASYAGTAATLTKGAAYNILGSATASVNAYINGADTGVDFAGVKGETVAKAGLADYAGATVEIVKNADGTKEAIVKVAYAAKVTKVTEATAKTDRKVDVTLYGAPIASATITTKNYAKDQYILVYLSAANAVIGHEAAQTAYGTLTATAGAAGATTSLYLDGVAVPVAGAGNDGVATADYTTMMNKKQTVVLYNGYALKVVGDTTKASLSNIVYVNKVGVQATDAMGLALNYKPVEIVHVDGTIEVVKAKYMDGVTDLLAGKQGTVAKMTETAGLKTFSAITAAWNADTNPYVAYDCDEEVLTATQKYVAAGVNAYFTANSTVVTVGANAAGETTTKVAAAPLAATLADAIVVYSKDTTNTTMDAYEVEVIFNKGTLTEAAADLYYVVGTDLGQVYVAATKTTYKQVAAYEVATGEKKTVLVALDSTAAGFCAYTVNATSGAYTFAPVAYDGSNAGKYYDIDAQGATDIALYGGKYMTIGSLADADVSGALVIDAKGTAVASVADLMAKDALTGASDKVTFSVVRTPATNKITAIVVTGY